MHIFRFTLPMVFGISVATALGACGSCDSEVDEQLGCDAEDCDPGEVYYGDVCVQPGAAGGPCNGLFNPICARENGQSHVCLNGTCQPGPGFIEECTVGQPCAFSFQHNQPTYCKDKACNGVTVDRCSMYADIYETCDSSSLAPKCAACKPGLVCDGKMGICLKPCSNDGECPCAQDGSPTSLCISYGEDSQACAPCVEQNGCSQTSPCCNKDKNCVSGECCTPQGEACSSKAECCGSDICMDAQCAPCHATNQSCSSDQECCPGNDCEDGVCREHCDEGKSCTVPGQQGACAVGQFQCPPDGPVCAPTSGPAPEECNGVDDDCNGVIDDIPPTPCPATGISGCQPGFEAPGTQQCVSQQSECVPTQVCKIAGGNCGVPAATPCIPGVNACIPNHVCAGAAGMEECNYDNTCPLPTPSCWLPGDIGLPPNHCYSP